MIHERTNGVDDLQGRFDLAPSGPEIAADMSDISAHPDLAAREDQSVKKVGRRS